MDTYGTTQHSQIDAALAAQLELLSGGVSGASTYLVHGLAEPCVLKVIDAESPAFVRARGYREIHFYDTLAADLPVRTPRVFARRIEESGSCALLIAAYERIKPATALRAADFSAVATQLARLHAVYWNRTEQLANLSWLARPMAPDLTNDIHHAQQTWLMLAERPQFHDILTASRLHDIQAALEHIRMKPDNDPDATMTLCHGDCHLGNLLHDQDGQLFWADWQEVCIGYGSSDLSFLIQRAEADGAVIVREHVVAAYCKALEDAGIEDRDEQAILSAMHESERRTRLLYWPDYMHDATAERMTYHVARIFGT